MGLSDQPTRQIPLFRGQKWRLALFSACLTFGLSTLAPGVAEAQVTSGQQRVEASAPKAKKADSRKAKKTKAKKTVSRKAKSNKGKKVKSRKSNKKVSSKSKRKKSKSKKVFSPTVNTQQAVNTSLFPAAPPAVEIAYMPGWQGMDPKESMATAQVLTVAAGNSIATEGGLPSNDPIEAPGPLPLLGAGAAFAYSRRLRRRIMRVSTKAV